MVRLSKACIVLCLGWTNDRELGLSTNITPKSVPVL
jgi:hypothetical protein